MLRQLSSQDIRFWRRPTPRTPAPTRSDRSSPSQGLPTFSAFALPPALSGFSLNVASLSQ